MPFTVVSSVVSEFSIGRSSRRGAVSDAPSPRAALFEGEFEEEFEEVSDGAVAVTARGVARLAGIEGGV